MISLPPADRKHIWAQMRATSERSMYAGTHFSDLEKDGKLSEL